jgi:hypothetical protein
LALSPAFVRLDQRADRRLVVCQHIRANLNATIWPRPPLFREWFERTR